METQTVLVVILSVVLVIFLIVAIVLTVMLIRVTRRVHSITAKAEDATDNFINVSRVIRKNLQPAVISGAIAQIVKRLTTNKRKRR